LTYAERGWNQKRDVVACTRAGPRALVSELVAAQPALTERELVEMTGYDQPTILRSLESEGLLGPKDD
jgi:hypothetical protein